MTPEAFVSRLDCVKPKGRDKWMACCPAHDDRDPSLSIAVAPDGKILLHCWAGCNAADVVSSVGLTLGDLFPEKLDYAPPMAFAQKERKQKQASRRHIDRARMMIALAESDRINGKRQSEHDMERELAAVRYLIEQGIEYDAQIVHAAVSEEISK